MTQPTETPHDSDYGEAHHLNYDAEESPSPTSAPTQPVSVTLPLLP